jgi:shikimate dehydrogenase
VKRVALLGSPVAHSVSPAVHNAAFAALRMPWGYSAIEVGPGVLADWIERIRGVDWAGANVTVPHKVAAARLVDELSETAGRIGAINTIVNDDGRLIGHNTDVEGFTADLTAQGVDVAGHPAVILGSGGAARAVAHALAALDARVRIVCRNHEAGEQVVATLSGAADRVDVLPWSRDGFRIAAERAAVIVNATPIGMSPDPGGVPWFPDVRLPRHAFVYDLVFNPVETRFVLAARRAGLKACGGLGMLVEQGARAFLLWTGTAPPRGVMTAAARAALERQHAQVSHSR